MNHVNFTNSLYRLAISYIPPASSSAVKCQFGPLRNPQSRTLCIFDSVDLCTYHVKFAESNFMTDYIKLSHCLIQKLLYSMLELQFQHLTGVQFIMMTSKVRFKVRGKILLLNTSSTQL